MVANACSGKAGWVEWGYQVVVVYDVSKLAYFDFFFSPRSGMYLT